jgi:hypothetical protein
MLLRETAAARRPTDMRSGRTLVVNLENHMMIRKMLLGVACAALVIGSAAADIQPQGRTLNGFSLNGFSLNGSLLRGSRLQGLRVNGARADPIGVNVGGPGGVGLDGRVIAIEF